MRGRKPKGMSVAAVQLSYLHDLVRKERKEALTFIRGWDAAAWFHLGLLHTILHERLGILRTVSKEMKADEL
jgi:hypothetical protein